MMKTYPKRLIEVDLPIKRISAHARREKNIRHGHISTLHIWWARRPLASCRAIICASLWPDPADKLCPIDFIKIAKKQMILWAINNQTLISNDSWPRFNAIAKDSKKIDDTMELRAALLEFIADFANWDNTTVPEYLETSRLLTKAAHVSLGGDLGSIPLVVDPFAGGGAIPLEALRVGADAFSSDLNPVAILLNKIILEYIPRYGKELSDEVYKWGTAIKAKAELKLGKFFPNADNNEIPIAYIWSRTILSEAPDRYRDPIEIPLIRSLWLSKKKGRKYAIRWVRDENGHVKTKSENVKFADGSERLVARPLLEIFSPKDSSEVEQGTIRQGSATCPVTGFTVPVKAVRKQLKNRLGGTHDSRLICVVSKTINHSGRTYRIPNTKDYDAITACRDEYEREANAEKNKAHRFPSETFSGFEPRRIPLPLYGIYGFENLFSQRSAIVITTLIEILHSFSEEMKSHLEDGLLTATVSCIGCAIDRVIDQLSSIVVWASSLEVVTHTFGRQALPMAWDYVEPNIFAGAGGDFGGALRWVTKVIENTSASKLSSGTVQLASARNHPLPDGSADAIITDPPYYYSVPYADLSDFFYVWLKRSIGDYHPTLFSETVTPKDEEIIQNLPHSAVKHIQKTRSYFEEGMCDSLIQCRRVAKPSAICVIVFAHTETAAWESMLQAIIDAGWVITGSWPIDTERTARVIAQRQSTLTSSIHLVCRPRENYVGSVDTNSIGDWRDLLVELPKRIHEWMPRLSKEGVVGADAIFACLGPALEIYSRYTSVEKASGEEVGLKGYLEEVWAAVSREALNMIFEGADASGFEEDARLTAMWLWTLKTAVNGNNGVADNDGPAKSIPGYSLEFDAARKIAQGLGAHLENLSHLVEIKGNTAMLLSAAARTRYLFGKDTAEAPKKKRKKKSRQMSLFDFGKDIKQIESESSEWDSEISGKPGSTILDQLHQSMILFAAGRGEAMKRFLVEEGIGRNPLFWRLAQALSALYPAATEEKRWVDGVLARKKGLGF